MLSDASLRFATEGVALVHNLICGALTCVEMCIRDRAKSAPSHFRYQNHLVWRGLHGLRQADVLVCAHKNDKKKNSQGRCV